MTLLLLLACAGGEGDDTAVATSGALSVLTYNVHGLPPEITGDDTTGRMEQIAPLLPPYDVIGLQEDWDDDNHAILDAALDHETRDRFNTPLDNTRVYGAGLSAYARAPKLDGEDVYYEGCYGTIDNASDCFASKGFQVLRLALGGGTLDFYNTHLEAGGGAEDDAVRAQQVDELVDAMATFSAGHAVLFVGDTNLDGGDPDDDPIIAAFEAGAGLDNACVLVGCPEPERIDRVMVRSADDLTLTVTDWRVATEMVDAAGVPLSDHEGITVGLSWESP